MDMRPDGRRYPGWKAPPAQQAASTKMRTDMLIAHLPEGALTLFFVIFELADGVQGAYSLLLFLL